MCSINHNISGDGISDEQCLFSTQLDYSWKWFDFHAKQRVSMFNYFLIASGILANAYVHIFSSDWYRLASAVAFIGFIIAIVFVILDCRNAKLVYLAEDVLRKLEMSFFPEEFKGLSEKGKQTPRGILFRESNKQESIFVTIFIKHKFCLKFIEIIIAICFGVGSVIAFWFDP